MAGEVARTRIVPIVISIGAGAGAGVADASVSGTVSLGDGRWIAGARTVAAVGGDIVTTASASGGTTVQVTLPVDDLRG